MSFYCPAVDGVYLRADGKFVCWNSPGEDYPLARLEASSARSIDVVTDVINNDTYRELRRSLHEHRDPFPFCRACSWGCAQGDEQWARVDPETFELRAIRLFQVEPSFACNLDCLQCVRFDDRKARPGPHILHPEVFRKVVDDFVRHRIPVEAIQYSGFGEPLMSPHFADLVRYAKTRLRCPSACDTNANFDFRPELLDCGLDHLLLAMDGGSQASYARYRQRGRFDRALRFARDFCAAKHRTGLTTTNVVWKTVLFEWNSSDDELRQICRLASDAGVDSILFTNTTTPGGISHANETRRWGEIRRLVEEELRPGCPIPVDLSDPDCFAGEPQRCYGKIEDVAVDESRVRLRGWALLDDGPADRIVAQGPEGQAATAKAHVCDHLASEFASIPDATSGGFEVSVECDPAGADRSVRVRLFRGPQERVHFTVRLRAEGRTASAEPMEIRHRRVIEASPQPRL